MACSFDGPPWNKNTRCLSKASFIRDEQKDGFTSALFPPLGPGLLVPLLLTAPLGPFSAGQRGCELRPLCSHVSVLVYSVRLCPLSQKTCKEIDQQLLTPPPSPHSDMKNTPAPLCVRGSQLTLEGQSVPR